MSATKSEKTAAAPSSNEASLITDAAAQEKLFATATNNTTTKSTQPSFIKLARDVVQNNNLPQYNTPLYPDQDEVRRYLPVFRSRPPSIPTKIPYPYFLNPANLTGDKNTVNQPLPIPGTTSKRWTSNTTPKVLQTSNNNNNDNNK
eukprot:UN07836